MLLKTSQVAPDPLEAIRSVPLHYIKARVHVQVAEEVFLLSRTVRTFGTEQPEQERYQRRLGILRHISIRQAAAYLLYLTSNSFLFNLTKVSFTETWYGQRLRRQM